MFKQYQWRIIIRVTFMFLVLSLGAYLLVNAQYVYLLVLVPVIVY